MTKAEAVLASAGLTAEAVTAQTLALKIDIVERIDRMMVTAEARRNAVLREDRAASRELRAHAAARRAGGRGRRGGRWRRHQAHRHRRIRTRRRARDTGVSAARRREANRANARASTGPKTSAGKARSAGNARRHGLSLPALRDPALSRDIVALARCDRRRRGDHARESRARLSTRSSQRKRNAL